MLTWIICSGLPLTFTGAQTLLTLSFVFLVKHEVGSAHLKESWPQRSVWSLALQDRELSPKSPKCPLSLAGECPSVFFVINWNPGPFICLHNELIGQNRDAMIPVQYRRGWSSETFFVSYFNRERVATESICVVDPQKNIRHVVCVMLCFQCLNGVLGGNLSMGFEVSGDVQISHSFF